MEAVILDDISFDPDTLKLAEWLKVEKGSKEFHELEGLVDDASKIARPKALYGVSYIDSRGDDSLVIDGIGFSSRVLTVNLEKAHRAFPFVATCGMELEDWGKSFGDKEKRSWAEAIKGMALWSGLAAFMKHLNETFKPGKTAMMNPGSLEDWPIREQDPLFRLLGDVKKSTGIELTEGLYMIPTMSVSGLRFPTEVSFESCQLCPREDCPGRRAQYDKTLFDSKYRK